MTQFVRSVLATVTAAGVIGIFVFLWQLNDRVARIETRLGIAAFEPKAYGNP